MGEDPFRSCLSRAAADLEFPGSVKGTSNGKLRQKTRELGFDVDPETLERKPSGHDVVLESQEVDGLF